MRANEISQFGGPEVLRLTERPDPVPGAGEAHALMESSCHIGKLVLA